MTEERSTHTEKQEKEPRPWRPTNRQALWALGLVVALVTLTLLVVNRHPGIWQDLSRERIERVAPLIGIGVTASIIIVLLAVGGAALGWTGFADKTLWEWLQLLGALAIPVVLAAAGYWFSAQQDQRQQEIEDQRSQDDALQAYLDQMTSLMLDKKELLSSELGDPIFTLARARTITVIARLDANHNKSVTTFLTEAGLTGYDFPSGCTLSDIELSTKSCSKDVVGDVRLIRLLSVVELRDADLQGAILRGADLSSANLNDANLSKADLSLANLSTAAKLVRTDLSNADLSFANLSTANLTDADLPGADLSYANSGQVLFTSANLTDADLSNATLNRSQFKSADLSGANLSNATLPGANLTKADLSDANLTKAVLSSTRPNIPPITTILTDADLSGADLTHARGVTSEELEQQAKSLEGATMPNGQKYENWLKSKDRGEDGENSGSS